MASPTDTELEPQTAAGTHADEPAVDLAEANYDDVNTSIIAFVAAVSAIVTLVVIIAVQALYFQYEETLMKEKVTDQKRTAAESLYTEQLQGLNEYGWVDAEKDIVSIPITDAMKQVVEEEKDKRDQQEKEAATDKKDAPTGT